MDFFSYCVIPCCALIPVVSDYNAVGAAKVHISGPDYENLRPEFRSAHW